MEKLNTTEVLHVADLARLNVLENEIAKYGEQLGSILTEIEKITKVDISEDGEILIAPTTNQNIYKEDIESTMLTKEEIFKNTKNEDRDYLVVPKVIND